MTMVLIGDISSALRFLLASVYGSTAYMGQRRVWVNGVMG
jgi:hypothetical protein